MIDILLKPFRRLTERHRIRRSKVAPGGAAIYQAWRQLRTATPAQPSDPVEIQLAGLTIQGPHYDLVEGFEEVFLNAVYAVELSGPAPFILDCGANLGLASLFFNFQNPTAQIIAFEPQTGMQERFRRNTIGNGIRNIELIPAACGKTEGTTEFFVMDRMVEGSATVKLPGSRSSYQVPVVKVSTFITRRVDLLKLDIEGGEWEVLEELTQSGKLAQVDRLIIEYHHRLDPQWRMSEFLKLLENAGYLYNLVSGRSSRTGRFDPDLQIVYLYAWRADLVAKTI